MIVIRKRRALRRAVSEIHQFIIDELDHNPAPIDWYVTDPKAKAVVRGLGAEVPANRDAPKLSSLVVSDASKGNQR